jgi:UDP-3-O-[3-hydroxymyristoyl] N-acetylglucosamine deacetylase
LPTICEKREKDKPFTVVTRCQRSIRSSVFIAGVALFSGENVTLSFIPAKPNTGIRFRRIDLPSSPEVVASIDNLIKTPRTTIIGSNGVVVQCVEHVLSALFAHKIDNIVIELDKCEPPIRDGSAKDFFDILSQAEIITEEEEISQFYLNKPIYLSEEGAQIIALPSKSLKCSYLLDYKGHPLLGECFYEFDGEKDDYRKEVASSRTFATLKEVESLVEAGLIKGISHDYGLVIDGDQVLNPEGLRFSNEMARHKVLDFLGDISLAEKEVVAHYISIRGGHALNARLTKKLHTMIKEQIDDSN